MIQISGGVSDYPFVSLNLKVIGLFEKACLNHSKSELTNLATLLRSLECYLQITDQTLNISTIKSSKFLDLSIGFVGALNDPLLFDFSQTRKYTLTRLFLALANKLETLLRAPKFPIFTISLTSNSEDVINCITRFQKFILNEEKLWLWKGWPCLNRRGRLYWAPLYPVYERLGREFTDQLYLHCKEYFEARFCGTIPCLKQLSGFIGKYAEPLKPEYFSRPGFVTRFFRLFLIDYIEKGYANGEGAEIFTLVSAWRNQFLLFLDSYLIKSGFLAEPWGELPAPPTLMKPKGHRTHQIKKQNGDLVTEKLLTDIPIHLTDEVALQLLFKQIKLDVEIASSWALVAAEDLWERAKNRLENCDQGVVLSIGDIGTNTGNGGARNRKNPNHVKNAASTYNHYLHIDNTYDARLLMPVPLPQTAYELGLPITGSFLPHCTLLIINHPAITPSFLENLQLFDKDGKQIGLTCTDGIYKLTSLKRRRGSTYAQQVITLNELTAKLVLQIISITRSIREYLKSKNDDSWRFLLLTAKQGFSKPGRIKKLASDTNVESRVMKFAESLQMTSTLSNEERILYANKFCLSRLRSSCGVLVYLETRSVSEMSKALGHAKYDPELIKRYLPEPINAFFQERWVRIFQAAIVIEVLKNSDFLLEGCGFANIDEIDTFLHSHALKMPPYAQTPPSFNSPELSEHTKEKVVFGINSTILTLLLSIHQAVIESQRAVHEKAKYWAELTHHLVSEIEEMKSFRPDLNAHLESARSNIDTTSVSRFIYG